MELQYLLYIYFWNIETTVDSLLINWIENLYWWIKENTSRHNALKEELLIRIQVFLQTKQNKVKMASIKLKERVKRSVQMAGSI